MTFGGKGVKCEMKDLDAPPLTTAPKIYLVGEIIDATVGFAGCGAKRFVHCVGSGANE